MSNEQEINTKKKYQDWDNSIIADYDNKTLIESLPAAIYICDSEGRIIFNNKAAEELWGRSPELGKDMWCGSWKIYTADGFSMALDACPMAVTLREGRSVTGEEIIIERPDGVRINVLQHPKPIFDKSGNITGAINMLVDITEKKRLDEQRIYNQNKDRDLSELLERKVEERTLTLQKSEERYHKMIEEVQDYAILLLDPNGNILNWNKGAENIKGYSEKEILGKNFRIFYLKEDREQELPEKLIKQASETGKAMHEGWRLKKNGEKFWGQIVITALHNDEDAIIGFSKVTRDLTERKLAEDQARSFTRDIEFRNKQLEEYAHIASHDLQEPLRKIQTFTEMLEKSLGDSEKATRILEKINSAARRMVILIKDVLQYSQLSQTDELFTPVDLLEILANVKEDYELAITEKKVHIMIGELPVVKGIPIQIQQLFSNLFGNSIKFSGENPVIEISSAKVGRQEKMQYPELRGDRTYIKIIFKDNGIGFDSMYADQIFKLFQRLHSNVAGTGIGLALCKKIVENHNGHIHVESELHSGTVFTIFFPV